MDTPLKISLCVTTWNRTDLVHRAIEQVIDDDRISEIIILDDFSDWHIYEELLAIFAKYEWMKKILIFRNQKNLDCYANKAEVLLLATNTFAILLDSDNIIDKSYIDAVYALQYWNSNTFHCPEFAKPHFDYRPFSGKTIHRLNVHSFVGTKAFDCLINTANYFVNRNTYLDLFDSSIDPHAADTIYMNTRLLESGGTLYVVPGMQYFHDVHKDSHYKANHKKSDGLFEELREKLNLMR